MDIEGQRARRRNTFSRVIPPLAALGLPDCDSPLEDVFLAAFRIACAERNLDLNIDGHTYHDVLVACQVTHGPYRFDFVIVGASNTVIVECDGHTYHDGRGERQASRERKRDRYCTLRRLPILHYLGCDIREDPLACAREALTFAHEETT